MGKKDCYSGGLPRGQGALTTTWDSPWATYQRTSRVSSRTLILTSGPIFDPEDVARNPERYLVDICAHEAEATRIWLDRRRRDNFWGEGMLMLRYQETELMPAGTVDDVCALWNSLLRLIEQFQHTGRAESSFFSSPIPIVLETIKRWVFFSVDGGPRTMVEPAPFTSSLVEEAERFFHWTEHRLRWRHPARSIKATRGRLSVSPGPNHRSCVRPRPLRNPYRALRTPVLSGVMVQGQWDGARVGVPVLTLLATSSPTAWRCTRARQSLGVLPLGIPAAGKRCAGPCSTPRSPTG